MRKLNLAVLITTFILTTFSGYSQYNNTIYIDPDVATSGDGSITNPYKHWGDWTPSINNIHLQDNTAYLQKRGTKDILPSNRKIVTTSHNTLMGAYGAGTKPIFQRQVAGARFVRLNNCTDFVIDNISFQGDTLANGDGISDVLIYIDGGADIDINNCELLYSGDNAMTCASPARLHIDSTIISRTMQEGIYFGANQANTTFEVSYCTFDNVNMYWKYTNSQWEAGGDMIQIVGGTTGILDYHIHHNHFDKSATAYKFIFISTGSGTYGTIEHNYFKTALDRNGQGGAGLYLGSGGDSSIIVRYNYFDGGELTPISNHSRYNYFYGNTFVGYDNDYYCIFYNNNYQTYLYNNIFYNCNKGIFVGDGGDIKNNIFVNVNNAIQSNSTQINYNCYFNTTPEGDNQFITDYPEFVDTANGDFHLLSTSPCIDAGTDVGLTVDADGTILPQGNGFDMGVFEYVEQMAGGDEIYIDPTNSGDPGQNGTYAHPFDNWEDIPWSDTSQINNKSVLQKRGTICETSSTYTVTNATGVTIGAYGEGEPPVLYSTNTGNHIIDFVWSKDCKVENLTVRGDTTTNGVALSTSAIRVYGYPYQNSSLNNNVQIENCTFENAEFGIRLVNGADVTITNCEISKIEEDGIYASDVSNLEISYCNIHDVNLKWYHVGQSQTESPGDGIELVDDCDNYNIHHNTIDRSNSGNKYCFSYSALSPNSISGVFDHNECITPLSAGDGGAAIYIGQGDGQEICYNIIEGEQPGIISMSDNLNIYYNIFKHLPTGILSLTSTTPLTANNNVFHDVRTHIQGGNLSLRNNIFNFTETGDVAINLTPPSVLDESNNLYSSGSGGNNSVIGDPMFVNPAADDFHLQNGSPCYDAGLDVGLTVDLDSIPVPQGIVPEIGTYELLQTNTAPQIDDQSFAIAENSSNGTQVGTVTATDPDAGQTLTFSITSGNTNNAFGINPTTGVLTVANSAVLDYETNPVFSLTVQVQDNGQGSLTDQATVTVNITDQNESPVINNQSFTIEETIGTGELVGVVQATDPDIGQTLTFSITSGNIDNAFAIAPLTGELTVADSTVLDFTVNPVYYLNVEVQDNGAGNLTDNATVTVSLTDVNQVPEILAQSFTIDENTGNGEIVGTVVATDPDAGQTLTFSIINGNTGNAFAIDSQSGEMTVSNSTVLDFETTPVFIITVQVQDDGVGNLTAQADITINLTDVNETPDIQDQTFTIAENSANGTQVGTVTAVDPDAGQTLTYSITSGNTNSAFAIDPQNGELTVSNSTMLDFETTPVFILTVQVQDDGAGNLTDEATITVNITDQNESPVIEDQSFSIEETIGTGELVGIIEATDPDAGQTLTFSIISGNIEGVFGIDPVTGELTVADSTVINIIINPVYYLTIEVQDNGPGNLTDDATITVSLTDINQSPEIEPQEFTIEENSGNGELVGTVIATDPDVWQTLTYSIVSGNAGNAFAIDESTGDLTVADSSVLDYETTPMFSLTVQVEDNGPGNLTADAIITINLTDINEVPEIEDYTFNVNEFSEEGTVVGTVEATDPDNGQTITYSIMEGNTEEAFQIDAVTGTITVLNSEALDYTVNPQFILTVRAGDNGPGNLFAESTVTIDVLQITNSDNAGSQPVISMSLYPNPATDNINIGINNIKGNEVTVRIFNVRGEDMFEKEYKNCQTDFNDKLHIGEYPKGVYIMYIVNHKTVMQRKFVKM